jgi:hypothetical protein
MLGLPRENDKISRVGKPLLYWWDQSMRTTIPSLVIALLFCLPVLAEFSAKQLTEDIDTVLRSVPATQRDYVTNYLRNGQSGLRGNDFLMTRTPSIAYDSIRTLSRPWPG